jgi:hypothetical protein
VKSRTAQAAYQLYTQAAATIPHNRVLGVALFLSAEDMLSSVPDPVDFLALTLRAENIVRRHLLPKAV